MLGLHRLFRDRLTIHCIAAILRRPESGGGLDVGDQSQIGNANSSGLIGTARCNINIDRCTCFNGSRITAVFCDSGTSHLDATAILGDGVIKGQNRSCRLVVRDRQCGIVMAVTTHTARSDYTAADRVTFSDRPAGICSIVSTGVGGSNVCVTQAG